MSAPLPTLRPADEEREARARQRHAARMLRAKQARAEARRRELAREARKRLNEDIRRAERADRKAQAAFDRACGVAEIRETGATLLETTNELIRLYAEQRRLEEGQP